MAIVVVNIMTMMKNGLKIEMEPLSRSIHFFFGAAFMHGLSHIESECYFQFKYVVMLSF